VKGWALRAYKIEPSGDVDVEHVFYGETRRACEEKLERHADICPRFGPAFKNEEVITVFAPVKHLPTKESVLEASEDDE
jgi:hypothetical protein